MSYIGSKPASKPVVASDLDPAVITGQTALAVAPADTDEFLISDAGTLKRLDASLVGTSLTITADNDATDYSISNGNTSEFSNGTTLSMTPASATSQVMAFVQLHLEAEAGGGDNDVRSYVQVGTVNSSGTTIYEGPAENNMFNTNMVSQGSLYTTFDFVVSNCERNSSGNVVVKIKGNTTQDTDFTLYLRHSRAVFMEIG